jgi:hypothetical protein
LFLDAAAVGIPDVDAPVRTGNSNQAGRVGAVKRVTVDVSVGVTEFVVTWPENDRQRTLFEDAVTEVIPALRHR